MHSLKFKSYAKINIGLKILGKRKDGFRNISTLFQEINFYDTLEIGKTGGEVLFDSNKTWLKNDNTNLCIKAFNKLKNQFDIGGIKINLKKRIPTFAGLGGGSSNAATILKGVNHLYKLGLSKKKLQSIGLEIGADVPFFIRGGMQFGEGIGEELTRTNMVLNYKVLLVMPKISIETKWAYEQYDLLLNKSKKPFNIKAILQSGNFPFKCFDNDFEKVVIPTYPEIGNIISLLRHSGSQYAGLSGSGSTVFGVFDDEADAKFAESILAKKHKTIIVDPV